MTTRTLGQIVRKDHLAENLFGFHPHHYFPTYVRCVIHRSGRRGQDSRARFILTFVPDKKSLANRKIPPFRIIEWWLYPEFVAAVDECIRARPFDFAEVTMRTINGIGELV